MSEISRKVVAAMSGGVDSSVAAAVFKEKGYEVIGVTLRLRPGQIAGLSEGCASKEDEEHAAEAAKLLGIEHRILDFTKEFTAEVLEPCWKEFSKGRTPNPCTLCNPAIKFGRLLKYASEIGAEGMITGHYAVITRENGIYALQRGSDPAKDQTYFLFGLTQEMLSRIHFPVGELTKPEVREYAKKIGLKNHSKRDSQDACFSLPGDSFQESLRKVLNGKITSGKFVTTDGKKHGPHQGIHQYTIGQRKGLGIALGKPAYVSDIDPSTGNVTVTTSNDDLMSNSFDIIHSNWQSGTEPQEPFKCNIQVRYRSRPVTGTVIPGPNGSAKVELDVPLRAVTTGQAAVFFAGDTLIGGGYIDKISKM